DLSGLSRAHRRMAGGLQSGQRGTLTRTGSGQAIVKAFPQRMAKPGQAGVNAAPTLRREEFGREEAILFYRELVGADPARAKTLQIIPIKAARSRHDPLARQRA